MMISLDEARSRITATLSPLPPEARPWAQAAGQVLARPLLAERTHPPFDASAMDGYAVRAADLISRDTELTLIDESAAGHSASASITAGQCIRISTGAPLPGGADQVVIQENTERESRTIRVRDDNRPGAHIRKAGSDFNAGDELLPAGSLLHPEALSLAVGAGVTTLDVHPAPRIAVIATGDELVEPGENCGRDQIINSISHGLLGLIESWGGTPVYIGIARDTVDDVRAKLLEAAACDLVVTIGGASVGDHDHLRAVFSELGGQLVFEKIAIKPGKPCWFGPMADTHVLGLPGNPVSAFVTARLLLLPAIARLRGATAIPEFSSASLGEDLPENGPRETFLRAHLRADGTVTPVSTQDSGALSALVQANALIRRKSHAAASRIGDLVELLHLENRT